MKKLFENWRKHLNEDSNSSKMVDKLNADLKELTDSEDFQGRGTNMYIEDITEPGESPKVRAVQTNSEEETVAISVWADFPAFLNHFQELVNGPRPEHIMFDLMERARGDASGGYVP